MLFFLLVVQYTGLGFFLTRFFRSRHRNNPLLWILLSIIFLPLLVSVMQFIFPLEHAHIKWVSLVFVFLSFIAMLCRKQLMPYQCIATWEKSRQTKKWMHRGIIVYLLFVYCALLIPKTTLLQHEIPAVSDDYNNTNKVLSVGYDLEEQPFFHFPSEKMVYYYYDFILPGNTFSETTVTARQALFIHAVIEYAAILFALFYVTTMLFTRNQAKVVFLLVATAVGGLEFWLYFFSGVEPPREHVEWWVRSFRVTADKIQITPLYTAMLWVPQHVLALVTFLMTWVVSHDRSRLTYRALIALFFAAMLGISVFVFMAAALAYGIAELRELRAEKASKRDATFLLFQIVIFTLMSAPIVWELAAKSGSGSVQLHPLQFFFIPIEHVGSVWRTFLFWSVNAVEGMSSYLLMELGVLFVAGITITWSLLRQRGSKKLSYTATVLLAGF